MESNEKIICNNIWKLFGPNEKSILLNLDKSLSRSEVQLKTGHVVAVKDVSFSIKKVKLLLSWAYQVVANQHWPGVYQD